MWGRGFPAGLSAGTDCLPSPEPLPHPWMVFAPPTETSHSSTYLRAGFWGNQTDTSSFQGPSSDGSHASGSPSARPMGNWEKMGPLSLQMAVQRNYLSSPIQGWGSH